MVVVLVVSALSGGLAVERVGASISFWGDQVTSNSASQENPDIYEYGPLNYSVVYQDNRNGNWDIYLSSCQGYLWQPEVRITTDPGNQISPKISRDIIVWEDDRNGNWDIYIYNLTSKVETQVTNSSAAQIAPAIDGSHIVWQDGRGQNWGIYVYDLETRTEQAISPDFYADFDPAVSGNRVVFVTEDYANDSWLKWYDLSTGGTQILDANIGGKIAHPAIFGGRVAWMKENRMHGVWSWEVIWRDFVTGANFATGNDVYEVYPDVYRGYIVYERYIPPYSIYYGAKHEVFLYFIDGETEYKVANSSGDQMHPVLSTEWGNYIVYMDNRNGNWDIYENMFGFGVGGPAVTPSPTVGGVADTGSQGLVAIMVTATAVVVVAVVGAAAFVAMKRRRLASQTNG